MKTKSTKRRRRRVGAAGPRGGKRATAAPVAVSDEAQTLAGINPRWRWHYRTLIALRKRLLAESEEQRREVAGPVEPHSSHAADSATDEFDHDLGLALLAHEENALGDVSEAITRILNGRYGICEATGRRIPASRLRAVPWCRYSIEAERQLERAGTAVGPRIPAVVSLRGGTKGIPGTGTITREDSEGPGEEAEERREAKEVADQSMPRLEERETAEGETPRGVDRPE